MNKKNMIYKNIESLQPIVNIVNEAANAINDKTILISIIHNQLDPSLLFRLLF